MSNKEKDLAYYFNSILAKSNKDNTYKFALARFLVEYSYNHTNKAIIIKYSEIAESFLEYYLHQICNYKIRQNFNPKKLPLIVRIIQDNFGEEYIPDSFEEFRKKPTNRNKIERAEREISRECFREVIPRFQNILEGTRTSSHQVFYEYDNNQISLKPQAMKYFKQNYRLLRNSVILEWAKFLEKINKGLPMIISKIEGHTPERASLERVQKDLNHHFDRCFYCNRPLPQNKRDIQVDHFIPWSYIYEDEMWNLILSCRECNLSKHGSLPPVDYIRPLLKRDVEYSEKIESLKKSLSKLDSEKDYEKAIKKYYSSCIDYGFMVWKGPDVTVNPISPPSEQIINTTNR